jgi:RHS repeat-associated protein
MSKTVGGVTTYFLYDGEDIIAEYDNAGTLVASYIHGPGIDEPVQMTRGGSTYFYTMDGLGSIRDLTDAAQSIVEQYDYDSFGNLTAPPATGNPYTYTSREYDSETGLLFYRARYYDPAIGRFLTEDPIGFEGGDVNFYAYVAGNPINAVDPSGLLTIPFAGWMDLGECAGQAALDYWAKRWAETGNLWYAVPAFFSALWTPQTSDATFSALSIGYGSGKWAGRPFWQYYPSGNPGYSSPWLTRGWGWRPPYTPGSQAAQKLALPPWNPGTAVRPVNPPWWKFVGGPSRVPSYTNPAYPGYYQPGGGWQYKIGGWPR